MHKYSLAPNREVCYSENKGKTNMLKNIIYRISAHRHPWRYMQFDELAEIYTSMTMRSLGFGVIGIFVPVYLYKAGVGIQDILLFFLLLFLFRVPMSFVVGKIVARIGPKHTIALSTLISIIFLVMLLSFDLVRWPLAALSFVYTASLALFFIPYNVDFSKVQHKNHGGKELGWLFIFEKAGMAAGPFLGGIVASIFAPEAAILVAIGILFGSLVPLFMTNEPIKTHQKISLRTFPNRKYTRSFISISALNLGNNSYNMIWPLFLAVFIFTEGTYFKLGSLAAISVLVAMFSAHMFGAFIDSKKGSALLSFGIWMGLALQIARSFVTTTGGAVAVNTLGEPIMLAYRMPLVKGVYDEADSARGHRIAYMTWLEVWLALTKASFLFVMFIAMFFFDEATVIRASFAVLGFTGLFMFVQRFPALKKV
jgi:MFS family permease